MSNVLLKLALSFAALAALAGRPSSAEACAAGPVSTSGAIGADAQRIFLSDRGDRTEVVVQVTVPRTIEDYGVLIPVPVRPVLDPTPVVTDELDQLDRATGVEIVDRSAQDSSSSGCGCGAKALGNDRAGGGVQVIDSVQIGPLTAVVLTSSAADDLTRWLSANSFVIPAGKDALIRRYTGPGLYFIAAKRSDTATSQSPSSLGVHFTLPGQQLVIPIPIAQLGATGDVSFAIFVAASGSASPGMPYAQLALADLEEATVRDLGYRAAIDQAVSTKSGRAFVLERVMTNAQSVLSGRLATFATASQTLTRLTTVTPADSLTADLALSPGGPSAATQATLDVTEEKEEGGCKTAPGASSWALLAVLVLALTRRRR